ncbi:MAG: gliding motility-associated C-terminal domain-containing protein [Bacteroidaceae bacterium]|nr:gliding motility-associated C-terminal domain-containing protein [Bacteroidaceae bacterium]
MTKQLLTTATLFIISALWLCAVPADAFRDDEGPTAKPTMVIDTAGVGQEMTRYTGSAPVSAHFYANVENSGAYTPLYEWHVYKAGHESDPYLVRYDEDFDYVFNETGTSYITLQISFVNGNDTIAYDMPEPFSVEIWTSELKVPNAFSPNGDGTNDIFRVKPEGYKSIVSFHGYIFNRHGVKLFEWTDITQGWDGTYHGHDVADGVYLVNIEARGADGRHYHIKKAINLLRGYTYNSAAGTN